MKFISFCCIALLGCQTLNYTNKRFDNLDDYKRMTQYIIDKNYHTGFVKGKVIDQSNTSDSLLIQFMAENLVSGIHILEISEEYRIGGIIRYNFGFKSIFSKGRELYFDFSSNPPNESYKKNGVKQIILEKGIYYREY